MHKTVIANRYQLQDQLVHTTLVNLYTDQKTEVLEYEWT